MPVHKAGPLAMHHPALPSSWAVHHMMTCPPLSTKRVPLCAPYLCLFCWVSIWLPRNFPSYYVLRTCQRCRL
ncbi:hypothetical protein LZ32DRAFT_431384 [Colletotrichum eremochloae]|nr:hypothetical protein LZ32DRAFT_431384 [Colletotrichum eremochloae]